MLVDGQRAPLLAALIEARARGEHEHAMVLAITATSREAEQYASDLASFLPDAQICELPAWETLPHERLSPSADTTGRRLAALRQLAQWREHRDTPFICFASVRAALQPLLPGLDTEVGIELRSGTRGHDLQELAERLVYLAYQRVDMVTRRGEFSVRGGILDVFPPAADHAVRIDFFGDEIDEIRPFSVSDQRSFDETLESVFLTASRELLLTDEVRARAREMEHEFPALEAMLTKIAEGIPVEGMESLAPALVDELVPITSYLPEDAAIAVLAPERVVGRAMDLRETNREFLEAAWAAATAGADAPIDLSGGDYLSLPQLKDTRGERNWWTFSPFGAEEDEAIRVTGEAVPSFAGNSEAAVAHAVSLLQQGWRVVMAANGQGLVERAVQVLADHGAAGRPVDELPASLDLSLIHI